MRQVKLIFWKDVRQFWWQVGAYVALLAAYTWAEPQTWPGGTPNSFLAVLVTLLNLLIMASQFVLITSAIHADALVGEEQFWITRPYDWRSLLGAKVLFTFACVMLPVVVMQWSLLHMAGLNPFTAKAGLASFLLRFVLVPCLPIMLIASVTESLAMAFAFLVVLLLAWAGTLQFVLSGKDSRMSPPFELTVFGALFGVLLLAILSYQFARRRTSNSRMAIAAVLVLFMLLIFGYDRQGFGAAMKDLIRNHYAGPPNESLRLVFTPGPVPYLERAQDLQYLHGFVELKLPVRLEGLPADAKIRKPNIAATLTANGMHYTTPWQNASISENTIGFPLPKDLFAHIADAQTSLHLELIAEEMRPARVDHVAIADRFQGPPGANCIRANSKAFCRYAYQALVPTHIEAHTETAACGSQKPASPAGAWLLEIPPGGRLDPVVQENLPLPAHVCPGDSLTFTEYGSLHRFLLGINVPAIKLRSYRASDY